MSTKVIAAMSGGVDSSVAAAILKDQGYDIIGITMTLSCSSNSSDRGCCSLDAARDAKKIAEILRFPHYTLNFKEDFQRLVIDNFVEEYKNGRTPNPCVRCNQFIKFDLLMRKAEELGAEFVATGHYARIMTNDPLDSARGQMSNEGKLFKLYKGVDQKKDQAYVLYRMDQKALSRTLFPLGGLTKEQVRRKAKELDLPVAEKEESQEICFVGDDNYARFLKETCPDAVKPGFILDKKGEVVGEHEGIAFYTIGQRKGLGAHRGEPKYVINIDRQNNTITIGDKEDTLKKELTAEEVFYISGVVPSEPIAVSAKIRYNSPEAEALLYPLDPAKVKIVFEMSQRSITPGQSVVFYNGEEVLGGGIINDG